MKTQSVILIATHPDGPSIAGVNDMIILLENKGWRVRVAKRTSENRIMQLLKNAGTWWDEYLKGETGRKKVAR